MFVKLSMNKPDDRNIWLNTDQIVSLEPVGKSFGVYLSNGNALVLDLMQYLVLIKAMKIKEPLKLVKEIIPAKVDIPKEVVDEKPIHKPSTAVFEKAVLKRAVVKQAKAKTLNIEEGKGTVVEKPKTKLIKKVAAEKLSFGDAVVLTKKGEVKKIESPLNERKRP